MEMEMKKLASYQRPHTRRESRARAAADPAADTAMLRYTSLRDILGTSPRAAAGGYFGDPSSEIPIRNRLVKRAASAYVQSAAILYRRNQNCLARLWSRVSCGAWWSYCAQRQLSSWAEDMLGFLRQVMECICTDRRRSRRP